MGRASGFACKECGSVAVVYPDHLSEDAPVTCRRCQTVICTLGEFRCAAGRDMARDEASAGGRGYALFTPMRGFPARWYRHLARRLGGARPLFEPNPRATPRGIADRTA
jgi:hypothetical protein